ncbi:hypothetical protein QPK87_03995 [Kamptonema cortianum]|nr:hypothetical protein [Oscillatoria laete-virens]MDK3155741.1 hypothetical protein [Kamptonema cortianum]MDL5048040.1 hypothetical protein [Oscillatoria amoena NRMC-F 0135]MDL5052522.1 hypothetical protein [Oscillatoria laete-virens NRMC-F 0139]
MKWAKIHYYPHYQIYRLVKVVAEVEKERGRPVCSRDIKEFYHRHPDKRPLLLRTLGHQLRSAAVPRKSPIPRIHQVGVFGKYGYYTACPSQKAIQGFDQFVREERIKEALSSFDGDFVGLELLKSPFENMARNAMRGWLDEISLLGGVLPEKYASIAADSFNLVLPREVWSREQAREILRKEVLLRTGRGPHESVQVQGFLVQVKWPLSALIQAERMYPQRLLEHFICSRWPIGSEDSFRAKAILQCLRYGEAFYPKVSS